MKNQISQRNATSEAAIFARLWESFPSLELAQQVLKFGFPEQDQTRMHELAAKNQRESLSASELEELDNYITVGDLLAILQSKARKYLKQSDAKVQRHG
jgi:hypothetical protein